MKCFVVKLSLKLLKLEMKLLEFSNSSKSSSDSKSRNSSSKKSSTPISTDHCFWTPQTNIEYCNYNNCKSLNLSSIGNHLQF